MDGNLAFNWENFKEAFEIYRVASGLEDKSLKVQSSTFRHVIGQEARNILKTFKWDNCDKECDESTSLHTVSCMIKKFDSHCSPKKNVTIERHIFFSRNQADGETFEAFATDLKLKAKTCEFKDLNDSLIKDRIVGGIINDQVRSRLLREPSLSLEKAEAICYAAEASDTQLRLIKDNNEVGAIRLSEKRSPDSRKANNFRNCNFCGRSHPPRKCPAYGNVCHNCGKQNHFKSVCRSAKVIQTVKDEEPAPNFYVANVSQDSAQVAKEWQSLINVHGRKITFTLDTGAQANILPHNIFQKLQKTYLQSSNARLTSYCGQQLQVVGKANLTCKTDKNTECILEFQILRNEAKPILGLQGCEALNLVQRIEVIEDKVLSSYRDVFDGIGVMKERYKIELDPSIPAVVHPPRKVPAALRGALQQELERMERDNIIQKVDYPTDWVSSLVIVEKKGGGLRLCLDPRDLNKAIKREHYQLPTIEEIVSRAAQAGAMTINYILLRLPHEVAPLFGWHGGPCGEGGCRSLGRSVNIGRISLCHATNH